MLRKREHVQDLCKWLNEQLEQLPITEYPFNLDQLPRNGIYFFYEKGEVWGHGGNKPRIVRIGTHKSDNFRSRIKEHFLLDDKKMNFNSMSPAPKDRSVFRKNIGRALLYKENSDYLEIWNKDFTPRSNREKYGYLRDIKYEKEIERQITNILRNNFAFRYFIIENETKRIGSKGIESSIIGTVARCSLCQPSKNWFGSHSPESKIRKNGLWQVQHLDSLPINTSDMNFIKKAIEMTKRSFF